MRSSMRTSMPQMRSFEIKGVNVHPGSAKDVMVNAALVAMEINAALLREKLQRIPRTMRDSIIL